MDSLFEIIFPTYEETTELDLSNSCLELAEENLYSYIDANEVIYEFTEEITSFKTIYELKKLNNITTENADIALEGSSDKSESIWKKIVRVIKEWCAKVGEFWSKIVDFFNKLYYVRESQKFKVNAQFIEAGIKLIDPETKISIHKYRTNKPIEKYNDMLANLPSAYKDLTNEVTNFFNNKGSEYSGEIRVYNIGPSVHEDYNDQNNMDIKRAYNDFMNWINYFGDVSNRSVMENDPSKIQDIMYGIFFENGSITDTANESPLLKFGDFKSLQELLVGNSIKLYKEMDKMVKSLNKDIKTIIEGLEVYTTTNKPEGINPNLLNYINNTRSEVANIAKTSLLLSNKIGKIFLTIYIKLRKDALEACEAYYNAYKEKNGGK